MLQELNSDRFRPPLAQPVRMEDWAERLRERMREMGWPPRARARLLAERTGITVDLCRKYIDGKVAQPRGNNLRVIAAAVERDIDWLRDGRITASVNGSLTDGHKSFTVPPEQLSLAAVEGKMEKQIVELWKAIGALEDRIEQLTGHEATARPTKTRGRRNPTKAS